MGSLRRALLPWGFTARPMVDIVVCDSPVLALILGDGFVLVVARLRIQRNDVPGMNEARNVPEYAKKDVDEGVSRAYSALDPDFRYVRLLLT